jgi:hypothetical protein
MQAGIEIDLITTVLAISAQTVKELLNASRRKVHLNE